MFRQIAGSAALQVSQDDIFRHVLNDSLLGSSIYVDIALAD